MKKLLLMATTLVAALTINAQTYDFSAITIAQSDLTVTNGSVALDGEKLVVKNTAGETVTMSIAQVPNVTFSYKNSQEKNAFKITPGKYIQLDGDQRDITFSNLTVGTKITLTVASKGGTPNSFEDSETKGTGLTGCVWSAGNKKLAPKEGELVFEDVTIQAIAPTATIRCTAGGYCLSKIVIGDDTAINNATADEKVQTRKEIINGQLYIIRDGVYYNALGAEVRR